MSLCALGSIAPLLVTDFSGFNRPNNASLVPVLSDGTTSANAVLQQGGQPWYQAALSGVLVADADVSALRGYYASRAAVSFTDTRGVTTNVRILELTVKDEPLYWTFDATLIAET